MGLKRTCLKMIRAMPGGWDAMAGALGMSRAALENRVYETKGQSLLAEHPMQMQRLSGTTYYAEYVCQDIDATLVRLPKIGNLDNNSLVRKFNELHSELGELSQKFNDFTQDGEIDHRERLQLDDVAAAIHRKVEELLALTYKMYSRPGVEE